LFLLLLSIPEVRDEVGHGLCFNRNFPPLLLPHVSVICYLSTVSNYIVYSLPSSSLSSNLKILLSKVYIFARHVSLPLIFILGQSAPFSIRLLSSPLSCSVQQSFCPPYSNSLSHHQHMCIEQKLPIGVVGNTMDNINLYMKRNVFHNRNIVLING